MKKVYLLATILGVIVPWFFLVTFFSDNGLAPVAMLEAIFANYAATAFTLDLVLSSIVFWPFMISECRARGIPHWWRYILINLALGLCVAMPLFLYDRENNR